MHMLCTATLVDVVGSAALVTQSEKSGVSLNMNIDYLRPGIAGEEVLVDAKVPQSQAADDVLLENCMQATVDPV